MKLKSTCYLLLFLVPILSKAQNNDDVYSYTNKKPIIISDTVAFMQGVEAAGKYYKNYKGIATTTFVVSLLNPLIGLAPAIGGTTGEPDLMHINFDKLKNIGYYNGYVYQSKSIRNKKVWKNWLYGSAISVGVTVAVISILSHNVK